MLRILAWAFLALCLIGGTASAQISSPGILQLATSCGLSGGPINPGSVGTVIYSVQTKAETGTSYTTLTGDCGKAITQSNNSASNWTLLAPATAGAGYFIQIENIGAGTLTLTPASGTINGAATLVLGTGQGTTAWTDGSNYFALTGAGTSGSAGPGFTIALDSTHTLALDSTHSLKLQ